VRWRGEPGLELDGGVGVGVVTKPGLGLELGGPAINPVPRAMITQAVGEAVDLGTKGVTVIISVPDGERMARKTTNARLGIIGGISILGTTGIGRSPPRPGGPAWSRRSRCWPPRARTRWCCAPAAAPRRAP
jgi:cobalt-precorrin-5B (C1)-methyltransferase